jgi:spore coat protein H
MGRWLISGLVLIAHVACSSGQVSNGDGGTLTPGEGGIGPGPDVPDGGTDGGGMVGRPMAARPLFDDTVVHQIALSMRPEDWQSILDDSRGDEWRHATLVYDGVTVVEVGVRPSGEASRFAGNVKQSMRIKFDAFPDQGKFGGIDVLKLKGSYDDTSMLRDRLAYFVFGKVMPAPREAHVRVVVNGELRGLYAVVEVWESEALKEHFSEPLGALYRLRGVIGTDPYLYIGDDTKAYVPAPWEQKLSKPGVMDDVVPRFLKVLADSPTMIEPATDVDNLLDYLAANALVTNSDGLTGDTGVEDHYQYHDPATGKFFVLPWDPDNTFGSNNIMPDRAIYARFSKSRLLTIIRDQGTYRQRYKERIKSVMAMLPVADVQAEVDRIYDQIRDTAYEDPYKAFANSTFDWSVGFVRNYVAVRYANVAMQIGAGP